MRKLIFLFTLILTSLPAYAGGYLKQSTATTINFNLVKTADGTGLTGATVANISLSLFKQSDTSSATVVNPTLAASGTTHDCVEKALGGYNVELTTTDTDTLGRLDVTWAYAAAFTMADSYMVVPAATYTAIVTTGPMTGDDLLAKPTSGLTTAGSWGKLLVDTLDAAVTTRLSGAAMSELSQGVPPATPTPAEALMGLWMGYRNTLTTSTSYKMIRNDAGTVVFKFTIADDGTTFTQSKAVSGP
jgi:hypothetical protein